MFEPDINVSVEWWNKSNLLVEISPFIALFHVLLFDKKVYKILKRRSRFEVGDISPLFTVLFACAIGHWCPNIVLNTFFTNLFNFLKEIRVLTCVNKYFSRIMQFVWHKTYAIKFIKKLCTCFVIDYLSSQFLHPDRTTYFSKSPERPRLLQTLFPLQLSVAQWLGGRLVMPRMLAQSPACSKTLFL